ncbi:MAG: Calx-beta domain-containing protein [Solirubrobacteraceae bacterium]
MSVQVFRTLYSSRTLIVAALVALALLALPGGAAALSVTDVGEGFPISMNTSDHILRGQSYTEENGEEGIEGPWSIWAEGKSTSLQPLNGGPETHGGTVGEVAREMFLYRINAAGRVGGTSTISYFDSKNEEHSIFRPVWFSPTGEAHEVPLFQDTVENEEGETKPAGGLGTGIDDAGDVVGLGTVQVEGQLRSRGFLSAGGTSHPTPVGEADGPWTEIFAVNSIGTMYGGVSELNEEGEPINRKYVLWSSPGATATKLSFDTPFSGFPLAEDGSVLGDRAGTLYLRAPDGKETEVAGLLNAFAVNASHVVIGSKTVSGVEHAAIWQGGEVTDLNTLLPKGSGWVLRRATAINDKGDVAGIGSHEGKTRMFLFKPEVALTASISGEPSVALPEQGTTSETFTVNLSAESETAVSVDYETEDGTATVANDDYTAAVGTLTFPPGVTSETIEVQIDDGNGNDEAASENYHVRLLETPTAAVASGAGSATGTVGLPGITGKLVTGPASGAATPLSPAPGISVQITGKSSAGQAVSQTVTSDATGAYTASVDPGIYSVTATGLPAGQPSGFTWSPSAHCPGKRKEATCEAVPVKAANGKVVQSTVDFGYGQRDPQVENVEVLQAVQLKNWDKTTGEIALPSVGKVSAQEYSGVALASKSQTIVRVYASNKGPGSAQAVNVQLKGYEASSGGLTPLPGGALTPLNGTLDALPEPVLESEHQDAGATFNFQLPESWTHGKIVLLATVDPEQQFPECAGCRANDNLALTSVAFTDVPALKFTPMSLDWTEGTVVHMPAEPVTSVTRTWPYWPLPTGGLSATGAPIHVDLTEALASVARQLKAMPQYAHQRTLGYNTKSLVGCLSWNVLVKLDEDCVNLVEGKIFAAEKAALGTTVPSDPVVGVYDDTGLQYGVLGAANNIPGKFSYVPASAAQSGVVVHEMLHQLGFKHSGCTSPSDEEAWPANSQGQASLVGFGEDRALNSLGGIGPILSTTGPSRGEGTHDIMSYCFPDWPSSFNWDRVLQRLASNTEPKPVGTYPAYSSLTATTASARRAHTGPVVTVEAIELEGSPVIADVMPGALAEAGDVSTPFTAVARNAHGKVIARVPIRASHTHADVIGPKSIPDEQVTMQVELPAGAASIAIAQGNHVLSSVRAPRGKLRLKVAKPSRAVCRRKGPLKLAYSASPRNALYSHIRVLALVGRRWKTIEIGAQPKRIVLAGGTRPRGSRKLRVEFNDGFGSVRRSLKLPVGCRAA